MNISKIDSISFGAKITRERHISRNKNGEKTYVYDTKKDLTDSYDDLIKEIKAQKKFALEVDSFMRSDEIKKMADKLPDDAAIQVVGNLEVLRCGTYGDMEFGAPALMYTDNVDRTGDEESEFGKVATYWMDDESRTLDKEGIKGWMTKLIETFGKKEA